MPPHEHHHSPSYEECNPVVIGDNIEGCDHDCLDSGAGSFFTKAIVVPSTCASTDSPTRPVSQPSSPSASSLAKGSVGIPPRRNSIPDRKSVTFHDSSNKIITIESAKSFSRKEIGNVWFSRMELQRIRKQCYQTLDKMNAGHSIDENKGLCVRGLEQYRRENMEVRTHIRRCANEAVFGMQKFQRYKGITLPDLLADLYGSSSARALSIAYKNGLRDAALASSVVAPSPPSHSYRRRLTCEV